MKRHDKSIKSGNHVGIGEKKLFDAAMTASGAPYRHLQAKHHYLNEKNPPQNTFFHSINSLLGITRTSCIQPAKGCDLFLNRPESLRMSQSGGRSSALWAAVYSHLIDLVSVSGTELRPTDINCFVEVCEMEAMPALHAAAESCGS